jgi:hypothetical protein
MSLTLPILYHGSPTADALSYTTKSDSKNLFFQNSLIWRYIPHSVTNWTFVVSDVSSGRKRHTMVPSATSSAFAARRFCIVALFSISSGAWRRTSERLVLILMPIDILLRAWFLVHDIVNSFYVCRTPGVQEYHSYIGPCLDILEVIKKAAENRNSVWY